MLNKVRLDQVLFLDIETVSQQPSYDELDERFQRLWDKKASYWVKDGDMEPYEVYDRAGIYAEFGKIVCISVGFISTRHGKELRLKSFYSDDEETLLKEFSKLLNDHYDRTQFLCAHNGKEFDIPYICRRLLVHGMPLPYQLDIAGKKPWEINHLDTMELWKFGDYKHYTSLDLLSAIFNIPTPKDDIDGSQVGKVYWEEKDLERIVRYCEKDVLTLANVFLKYRGEAILDEGSVHYSLED